MDKICDSAKFYSKLVLIAASPKLKSPNITFLEKLCFINISYYDRLVILVIIH